MPLLLQCIRAQAEQRALDAYEQDQSQRHLDEVIILVFVMHRKECSLLLSCIDHMISE